MKNQYLSVSTLSTRQCPNLVAVKESLEFLAQNDSGGNLPEFEITPATGSQSRHGIQLFITFKLDNGEKCELPFRVRENRFSTRILNMAMEWTRHLKGRRIFEFDLGHKPNQTTLDLIVRKKLVTAWNHVQYLHNNRVRKDRDKMGEPTKFEQRRKRQKTKMVRFHVPSMVH
jgi:hypothetical protein